MIRRQSRYICFAVTALAVGSTLSACSVLPKPAPADVVYRLSISGAPVTPRPDAQVIQVERPSAIGVFDSNAIIASPDGRRLSSLAQARWPQRIPSMIQGTMIDAMRSSDAMIGVLPTAGTRTDTRLHLTIKNFEAKFDRGPTSAPLAVVRYTAELTDAYDRTLIETFSSEQTSRAGETRVSSIVEAMERANDAALKDIVAWLEDEMERASAGNG